MTKRPRYFRIPALANIRSILEEGTTTRTRSPREVSFNVNFVPPASIRVGELVKIDYGRWSFQARVIGIEVTSDQIDAKLRMLPTYKEALSKAMFREGQRILKEAKKHQLKKRKR